MNTTTRAQRLALKRIYEWWDGKKKWKSYLAFRRSVRWAGFGDDHYLIVNIDGLILGIELNGYTHS